MNNKEAIAELQRRVNASSQLDVARALKFTPQFICDVLKGRRPVTEKLAARMGYKKVISFVPSKGAK